MAAARIDITALITLLEQAPPEVCNTVDFLRKIYEILELKLEDEESLLDLNMALLKPKDTGEFTTAEHFQYGINHFALLAAALFTDKSDEEKMFNNYLARASQLLASYKIGLVLYGPENKKAYKKCKENRTTSLFVVKMMEKYKLNDPDVMPLLDVCKQNILVSAGKDDEGMEKLLDGFMKYL
eukprot:m.18215 g.18215  ORF g.18215 m.18215 type:complete len:183 (+) comp9928_c0_seq1:70-618(+)